MATYIPLTNLPTQFVDNNGDTLVNGTLEFYLAGTTTATDLFTSDGTSIGTSITLNSWGYPESGGALITLFRDQSIALKVVSKNAAGATVYTTDNIPAVASFDSSSSAKVDFISVTQAVDLDQMEIDIAATIPAAGGTLTGDLTMGAGTFFNESVTAAITASVTQTQGQQILVSGLNEISVCANDNDTVTLPTAVAGRSVTIINNGANTLQIFPNTDDSIDAGAVNVSTTLATGKTQLYKAKSTTVWESILELVTAVASGSTGYGSFYDEDNTTAYTVHAQDDHHAYHTASIADGGVSGWVFDAGSSGLSVAIASIADGADSGVDIEVTTTGNHGLTLGDLVSQTNLASAVYTGFFIVKAIISATQYEVAAVYTATDTGFMDAAATLTCVNPGTYVLDWSASASAATSSDVFDFFVHLNASTLAGSTTRRKFGTGGDIGAMTGTPPAFAAVAGDKIGFALSNTSGTGDITNRNMVVRLNELV